MAIPSLEFHEKVANLFSAYGYNSLLVYAIDRNKQLAVLGYGIPGSFLQPIFENNTQTIEKTTGTAIQQGETLIKIKPNDNKLK
jgi:hypothetical protein